MPCMPWVPSEPRGSTLKLRDPDERTELAHGTKSEGTLCQEKKGSSIIVSPSQFAERILEVLSALPLHHHCPNCGSDVTHRDTTFSYNGEASRIKVPVCPKCSQADERVNSPTSRKIA